jgi:hypothetical protein
MRSCLNCRLAIQVAKSYVCEHCGVTFAPKNRQRTPRFCTRQCHAAARTVPPAERFWQYVTKSDGCWEWTGPLYSNGYGDFSVRKKHHLAHRYSFELAFGPIVPNKLCVLHRCDNRPCVRPDHLFLGTRGDNNRDCANKGRTLRSDKHPAGKLTDAQTLDIRRRSAAGESGVSLAMAFNVSTALISLIVNRKIRYHV